jgi:hypothetical protein
VIPLIARDIVDCETPCASAISAWTRLRRRYVNATTTAR